MNTHAHTRGQKGKLSPQIIVTERNKGRNDEDTGGKKGHLDLAVLGGCQVCWLFSNVLLASPQKAGAENGEPY